MSETTITQLPDPLGFSADPFTEVIRDGARKLIEQADHAAAEQALYATFYGEHGEGPDRDRADRDRAHWDRAGRDRARWREIAAFVACVLRPLEWSGLLLHTDDTAKDRTVRYWHKTPLWRSALKLETDEMLPSLQIQ